MNKKFQTGFIDSIQRKVLFSTPAFLLDVQFSEKKTKTGGKDKKDTKVVKETQSAKNIKVVKDTKASQSAKEKTKENAHYITPVDQPEINKELFKAIAEFADPSSYGEVSVLNRSIRNSGQISTNVSIKNKISKIIELYFAAVAPHVTYKSINVLCEKSIISSIESVVHKFFPKAVFNSTGKFDLTVCLFHEVPEEATPLLVVDFDCTSREEALIAAVIKRMYLGVSSPMYFCSRDNLAVGKKIVAYSDLATQQMCTLKPYIILLS